MKSDKWAQETFAQRHSFLVVDQTGYPHWRFSNYRAAQDTAAFQSRKRGTPLFYRAIEDKTWEQQRTQSVSLPGNATAIGLGTPPDPSTYMSPPPSKKSST